MSKRQRVAFSSNSQLCHVWAQQTQTEGRANNMFFDGPRIYSYGRHFLAAQVHTVKGQRIALVNSHSYSNSTAKHLGHIRSALNGLMPYYCASDVTDPKRAVKDMDARAAASLETSLRRIKVASVESIQWDLSNINDAYREASALRAALGLKPIEPSKEQLDKVEAHLTKRLARYHELNTPEMRAKREAEAKVRAERKHARDIERFRAGETSHVPGLRFELLRLQGDQVITSRGARVPMDEALRLFRDLKSGNNFADTSVGHFRFQSIDRTLADPVVTIGCHRILLSEAERLFGQARSHLSVVQGGAA